MPASPLLFEGEACELRLTADASNERLSPGFCEL
jgi:hypothetical protein